MSGKNCGIMRTEKVKMGAVGGIEAENNRDAEKRINLPRSDIDWDKTKDNIHLVKSENWRETIKGEVKEKGIGLRKDAVVLIDGLYTASPEFFDGKNKEETLKYFSDCLDFHRRHYGKVINAVIHLDEKTPHLHVVSIPLIDRGGGKWSLSAKDIMGNPKDYHRRQDEFHRDVSSKYDLDRGDVSDREHIDTLRLKEQTAKEELAVIKEEKTRVIQETIKLDMDKSELEAEVEALEEVKTDLQAEVEGLKVQKEEIAGEVEKAEAIRTLREWAEDIAKSIKDVFGSVVTKTQACFERLCKFIEMKIPITRPDLSKADCKFQVLKSTTGTRFYTPATKDGEPLTWEGNRPLYTKSAEDDRFFPFAVLDTDKDVVKWGDQITADKRDKVEIKVADRLTDIEERLEAFKEAVEREEARREDEGRDVDRGIDRE